MRWRLWVQGTFCLFVACRLGAFIGNSVWGVFLESCLLVLGVLCMKYTLNYYHKEAKK